MKVVLHQPAGGTEDALDTHSESGTKAGVTLWVDDVIDLL